MSYLLNKWVRLRLVLVGVFLAALGLVLTGRFIHLQVLQGSALRRRPRPISGSSPRYCPSGASSWTATGRNWQ